MQPNPCWARGVYPLAWLMFVISLSAQPNLATIEDTVYRADGQKFDGLVLIEWRSFLAADYSSIAAYSKNARVISGVLKLSLVPTTTASPGAYYIVKYSNNGRILFTEYWAVPPGTVSLKLKDVRLVGPPALGSTQNTPPSGLGAVEITDVVGLTEELAARAKKGIGFIPSRTAMISSGGDVVGVNGDPNDCVKVNGTTGPCATAQPSFFDNEIPAGLVNGTNTTFTLSNAPDPASSLHLYRNGVHQKAGIDFNLTGNTVVFVSAAVPQSGDQLGANYRMAGMGGIAGGQLAGGSLTGFFPAPSIALGAIANLHISDSAGIVESKLALNHATHSTANDPTPQQKAALAGTAGSPSTTNRYVTDEDSRLTNARAATGHALLGGGHYDTNPAVVGRGDLLIGMGTSPTMWSRLPLGPPNRCLISNGFDAVWNSCLFTGFPAGTIPFVDASGNLVQNNSRLFWDNANRRLSIGASSPTATLMVYDSAASEGKSTVLVRSGEGQGTEPLQKWQDGAGADLARVEADGQVVGTAIRSTTTGARAAWQETGSAVDPANPAEGDLWMNTAESARKTYEMGQKHVLPQVICSRSGISSYSTGLVDLGKCRIPNQMVRDGDRFEVRFEVTHEGTATPFSYTVKWGDTVLTARSGTSSENAASGRSEVIPQGINLFWSWQSWGSTAAMMGGTGTANQLDWVDPEVSIFGQMTSTTTDTVTLRNLTVVRIPALANQ